MFSRATIIRIAVYLTALLVVIWLLRERNTFLPAGDMTVTGVHRAERWGNRRAGPGEQLVMVTVRFETVPDGIERWSPGLFRLEDEAGRLYRPLEDSPLLAEYLDGESADPVGGLLVFRLPAAGRVRSLLFFPEDSSDADFTDHQSEDTRSKSGP